jgi:hypothetical protein
MPEQDTLYPMKNKPARVSALGVGVLPVVSQAVIADASVAHTLNATFSDTEAEAALNALGVKVNAVIAVLRSFGLIATA